MNAFVTGGTGFIGTRVLELLRTLGVPCRALVRRQEDAARVDSLGAAPVLGNLTVRESLLQGMRGCDTVISIAGLYSFWIADPTAYRQVNVDGTRHVMEAALQAGTRKVVHVSTAVIYGKPAVLPFTEDSEPGPSRFSEYARTKYEGDLVAWRLHREKGLPLVVVYPVGVLGPADPKATGQYVSNLINGRLPALVFVDSSFTWVHVKDVAEVIVRAADRGGQRRREVSRGQGAGDLRGPEPDDRGGRWRQASKNAAAGSAGDGERTPGHLRGERYEEAANLGDGTRPVPHDARGRDLRRKQGRKGAGGALHAASRGD